MRKNIIDDTDLFVSLEERRRLIVFCARMTKNQDVVEDLAQETLLEAWSTIHTLRDAERREAWLFGVARNVCLRWLRAQGRARAHILSPQDGQPFGASDLEELVADDLDISIALEQKELAELLDRALLCLPAETRSALLQRYVEESSLAEIATRLGTHVGAVAMRLQRGKLVLRRVLTQELGQQMDCYTAHSTTDVWEVTPLWCQFCGQQRLLGQRDPREGKLTLKCPVCNPGVDEVLNINYLPALKGVRGYKPLYSRLAAWCDHYYRAGLKNGSIDCVRCGLAVPVRMYTPEQFPRWMQEKPEMRMWMRHPDERVVVVSCEHCEAASITTLESLVVESAPGQQFLKTHTRIRTLPRRHLEAYGRPTILTRFASVTDSAVLDILSDEETYELVEVHGGVS